MWGIGETVAKLLARIKAEREKLSGKKKGPLKRKPFANGKQTKHEVAKK